MTTRPRRKKTTKAAARKPAKKRAGKKAGGQEEGGSRRRAGQNPRVAARRARAEAKARRARSREARQRSRRAKPREAPRKPRRRAARSPMLGASGRRPKATAAARIGARARRRAAARRPSLRRRAPRVAGVAIKGAMGPRYAEVLTPAALRFLADLHREFEAARERLLAARAEQQARYDAGELPDFRPGTKVIRDDPDWRVAPIPPDLHGPPRRDHRAGRPQDDRQRAQFRRQRLHGGFRGRQFADLGEQHRRPDQPEGPLGRQARLHRSRKPQALPARRQARGADRAPARLASRRGAPRRSTASRSPARCSISVSASSTTRKAQIAAGTGPYFYLPEARDASRKRGCGTTCSCSRRSSSAFRTARSSATVLIETLPAAFEMEEILYELRDHVAGLNAGRWDYIFSFIKKLAKNTELHPARPRRRS